MAIHPVFESTGIAATVRKRLLRRRMVGSDLKQQISI
jgi:hypothetical protein